MKFVDVIVLIDLACLGIYTKLKLLRSTSESKELKRLRGRMKYVDCEFPMVRGDDKTFVKMLGLEDFHMRVNCAKGFERLMRM